VDAAIAAWDAALAAARDELAGAERLILEREVELEARRAEVDRVSRRVRELEQIATRLAERVAERERELREVRAEIAALRAQGDEGLRALGALAEDLEMVRQQARRQATRMRMRALRQAAQLIQRSSELSSRPDDANERLIEAVEQAIAGLAAEDEEDADPLGASNGHLEREPGELFDGLVEVEVGPLSDFSQLVGFEDAAAGIGASSEISVKRFTRGRATLAIRFKQPVELLRELEERAPFGFKVRDMRADRIVLDVAG
jgi:hypothetical protein